MRWRASAAQRAWATCHTRRGRGLHAAAATATAVCRCPSLPLCSRRAPALSCRAGGGGRALAHFRLLAPPGRRASRRAPKCGRRLTARSRSPQVRPRGRGALIERSRSHAPRALARACAGGTCSCSWSSRAHRAAPPTSTGPGVSPSDAGPACGAPRPPAAVVAAADATAAATAVCRCPFLPPRCHAAPAAAAAAPPRCHAAPAAAARPHPARAHFSRRQVGARADAPPSVAAS